MAATSLRCGATSAARGHSTLTCGTPFAACHERTGYLLDPHSAIGYRGLLDTIGHGVFLATAHPAKFGEIVEPIIGRPIEKPPALADAIARPRHIVRIDASFEAVRHVLTT